MPLLGRRELQDAFAARVDMMFRALTLEAMRRLIKRTPVDTGRARGNWNVGIGAPNVSTKPEDHGFDKSGRGAIAEGTQVALNLKSGEVAYITNSLPYIPALNQGSSSQMPAGWIELTMAELDVLVEQIQELLYGQ